MIGLGTELEFGAVVHDDFLATGQHVAHVRDLAAGRSHVRLGDLHRAPLGAAVKLIRRRERLLL
jgi:hypothetical protein